MQTNMPKLGMVVMAAAIAIWVSWGVLVTPAVAKKALVEVTGQTTSYADGDDGDIQSGVPFPSPRFIDKGKGTVKDKLTGLIWLKNAGCFFDRTWPLALTDANTLASGSCGLTDGSIAGDWRLPNVKELQSLIDFGQVSPALPDGHPFSNVLFFNFGYWSSTTHAVAPDHAWYVNLGEGHTNACSKPCTLVVWPVRGGQ